MRFAGQLLALVLAGTFVTAESQPSYLTGPEVERELIGRSVFVQDRFDAQWFPANMAFQCKQKLPGQKLGSCEVWLADEASADSPLPMELFTGQWQRGDDSLCIGVPKKHKGFCFGFRQAVNGTGFYLGEASSQVEGEWKKTSIHASIWEVDLKSLPRPHGLTDFGMMEVDFGAEEGWRFTQATHAPAALYFSRASTNTKEPERMAIVSVPNDAKEVMPENFQKTEIDRLRSVTQKRGGIIISERPATMDAPGCFSAYEPSEQTRTALHSYDCVVDYDEHWYTLNVFLETTLFDSIEENRLASERLAQRIRFH